MGLVEFLLIFSIRKTVGEGDQKKEGKVVLVKFTVQRKIEVSVKISQEGEIGGSLEESKFGLYSCCYKDTEDLIIIDTDIL